MSYVSGVCDVIFGDEFKFTSLSVPYCLFSVIECVISLGPKVFTIYKVGQINDLDARISLINLEGESI
jgi:hypothetical protein